MMRLDQLFRTARRVSSWSFAIPSRRNWFAASGAPSFVVAECLADLLADCCFLLNLRSQPDAELQYPLKLLSVVVPPVVVADRMSWKIVVD